MKLTPSPNAERNYDCRNKAAQRAGARLRVYTDAELRAAHAAHTARYGIPVIDIGNTSDV